MHFPLMPKSLITFNGSSTSAEPAAASGNKHEQPRDGITGRTAVTIPPPRLYSPAHQRHCHRRSGASQIAHAVEFGECWRKPAFEVVTAKIVEVATDPETLA
jgi:hypothetical protein